MDELSRPRCAAQKLAGCRPNHLPEGVAESGAAGKAEPPGNLFDRGLPAAERFHRRHDARTLPVFLES
jgi:hypothetical protein